MGCGLVTCILAAPGGWWPSLRFYLWGGCFSFMGIIVTGDCSYELGCARVYLIAKSALCTLAWQCWSDVHCPENHAP